MELAQKNEPKNLEDLLKIENPYDDVVSAFYTHVQKNSDYTAYAKMLGIIDRHVTKMLTENAIQCDAKIYNLDDLEEIPAFDRLCANVKKQNCVNFLYTFDVKGLIIESYDHKTTRSKLLFLDASIKSIQATEYKSRDIYKRVILACLNYQLVLTISYHRIATINDVLQNYENLHDSQKKIIRSLDILLSADDVLFYPMFMAPSPSKMNKLGDIPMYIITLNKTSKSAHGVHMFPLSFMFHDIQHAFEMYKKKKLSVRELTESNINKCKLLYICSLYAPNGLNDNSVRAIYKCMIEYVIFYYLHEEAGSLNRPSDLVNYITSTKTGIFYVNRFRFIEDDIMKSVTKEFQLKNMTDADNRNIRKHICLTYVDDDSRTTEALRKVLSDSVALLYFAYTQNVSTIKMLLEKNDVYHVLELSKVFMFETKTVDINNVDSIVFSSNININRAINSLSRYDFIAHYSDVPVTYGYHIRKNIVFFVADLHKKPDSVPLELLKTIIDCIVVKKNVIFPIIGEHIVNNKKSTLNEIALYLLLSKHIPLHVKIMLLVEHHKYKRTQDALDAHNAPNKITIDDFVIDVFLENHKHIVFLGKINSIMMDIIMSAKEKAEKIKSAYIAMGTLSTAMHDINPSAVTK